jgi:hypothetical protein
VFALFIPFGWCLAQIQPGLIMTWEEFARQRPRTPCVLRRHAGAGELLYYGARHTFRSDDPQIAEIERLWAVFQPTIAFSEGGIRPATANVPEAVRRYGEPGLVRLLADRHQVQIRSIEPPRDEEIVAMLSEWPPDRVKLYYFLRAMMGYRREVHDQPANEYAMRELEILNRTPRIDGRPRIIEQIEAALATLNPPFADWRVVPENLFDPTRSEAFTNEFSRKLSLFRDEHMLKNLVTSVLRGERVFAVVGSTHVIMQERALKAALPQPPQSKR